MKPTRCVGSLLSAFWACQLLAAPPLAAAKPRRPPTSPTAARTAPPLVDVKTAELNAAHAALVAGRIVDAHDRIRRLLAGAAGDAPLAPAAQERVQAILATPLPAAGEVAVMGEPGTLIRVDDQPLTRLPLPLPLLLTEGPHQIVLEGRGTPLTVSISVRAGRRLDMRESREAGAIMLSQPPHALLFVQHSTGEPSPSSADALRVAAEQGLRGTPLSLLPSSAELTQKLRDCGERATCLAEIAQRSEVEYIVLAQAKPHRPPIAATPLSVSATSPATTSPATTPPATTPASPAQSPAASSDTALRVALFDARVAEPAALADESCAACAPAAVENQLRDLVSRITSQGLSRPRGMVRIKCQPAECELQLNGAALGRGPVERSVWSGELAIVASYSGYRPQTLRRFVADGANERIDIELSPVPPPTAITPPTVTTATTAPAVERAPRPLWRLLSGSAALLGGSTLIGFGAGALSVNGSCIDVIMPPQNQCSRLYQTSTLGTSLLVSGAAVAVAGVVLLAVPGPKRPHHATAKRP